MAAIGSLDDLLLFYTLERVLFNRMVVTIQKDPYSVKRVMALWLSLEELGYHDLIRTIQSFDDKTIAALLEEGLYCLDRIQPNAAIGSDDTPVFVSLFDEPMNRNFFILNREFMFKRVTHTMETVCNRIFGDRAALEVGEPSQVDSPGQDGDTVRQSMLNPDATEFVPGLTPEDTRTMFLTFSIGQPLSREEIIDFFTMYATILRLILTDTLT